MISAVLSPWVYVHTHHLEDIYWRRANVLLQAVGGTIWHGIKGFRNSPYGERRIGALTAIKMRAPVLGGNFGVWGGLFSTFDCTVKGIRKKEDPYNAIIAGFFTGGALAIRGGYKAARNGAIGCAVLLAVIEGVGIGFQKMLAGSTKLEVGHSFLPLSMHLSFPFANTSRTRCHNPLRPTNPSHNLV
ncbi:Tim17/Tim22/Tim23/Pmp24 family-domain-containing protein [Coniochaeta sp. 2T2.1]|nr:Tim17/Tim22/Tim23/Pmp24 family-domain-containing protein [Coniochaeta sp. 2T2.1]